MSVLAEIDNESVQETLTSYRMATRMAIVLCGLLTLISLAIPPSVSHDPAWGMQEWRSWRAGNPLNTLSHPDSDDISKDVTNPFMWWSPGQYLVPGALTLLGLRLGTAFSLVAGLSLLSCLLGWIEIARYFALFPKSALLFTIFIATFRYSTLPFGVYNGGEVLLQGLTPWLILLACRVSSIKAVYSAPLVFLAVLLAFFLKLTGIIVVGAALLACGVEVVVRLRRVTAGMMAGAVGAAGALGVLKVLWFSRGSTPASGTTWSFRAGDIAFSWGAPWGAGVSWIDMFGSVLLRHLNASADTGSQNGNLTLILWLLLPTTILFVTILIMGWRHFSTDANLAQLLKITILFYVVCALAVSVIFVRGGDVSVEERHLRAAGTLIFVCAMAVVSRLPSKSVVRRLLGGLCLVMAIYGILAFLYRAHQTHRSEIDGYSETYQPNVDPAAIRFLRTAFAREGREAVFVLPAPEAASAFPPTARILLNQIEFETEPTIAARIYHGRAHGHIFIVVPANLSPSAKQTLLLKEFADYPVDGWQMRNFGASTIFFQPSAGAFE